MVKSVAQLRKNLGERTCDDDGGEWPYARRHAATVRRADVVRDAAGLRRNTVVSHAATVRRAADVGDDAGLRRAIPS